VYNALALLDLTPHYLTRPWLEQDAIAGPMDPASVDELLKTHPEIKTVSIVSPTYYGVLSDIPAIAAVCHGHGAKLMVDAAHGAHLPFLGYEGFRDADLVVFSAHKTLPALGQTALLLANGFSMDELRRFGSVYGSSSPSYLMMASLDLARDWMDREGAKTYTKTARLVEVLREKYPSLRPGPLNLDPTRLVLTCPDGFALAESLRERHIYPEMADRTHVVFIFTASDGQAEASRLTAALDDLLPPDSRQTPASGTLCPPPLPERVLSPREALFAPRETVDLTDSEGRVSACQVAPYPPGVPVIAPGERIEKKHLAYLARIGYNRKQIEAVL
jgi:lysine decarboxylase